MDPLLSHFLPNLSFLRKNFSERNIPRRITFFSKGCNRVTIGSTSNVSPLQFSVFIPFHWDSRWEDLAARNSKGESKGGNRAGKSAEDPRRCADEREREARPLPKGCVAAWLLSAETLRAEVAFNPRLSDSQPPNGVAADSEMQPPLFCLLASFFPSPSFLQHWIAFIRDRREWKTWSSMINFNQILQNKNSFYSCVLLLFEYDNRRWKIFLTFIILLFTNIY